MPRHDFALSTTRSTTDAVPLPTEQHSLARIDASRPPTRSGSPRPAGPNRKKQRSSRINSDRQLTKSTSTPYLRGSIMSESELDKKRNKLGYQRISIACAHCRRRKIRCVLAEDDPEQRCQNCIRLKKECLFYPVDQQAMLDARSESSSKSGAPSAPQSAVSTSPTQQGGQSFDAHAYTGAYPAPSLPPVSTSFHSLPAVPPTANYSPQAYTLQTSSHPPSSQWGPSEFAGHNRQIPAVQRPSSVQPPFPRFPPAHGADVAPYPGSDHPGQVSSNAPHAPYSYRPDQMQQPPPNWQPETPADRAISYPEYVPNYSQYQQAHTSSSSYPRQPVLQPPMTAMMQMHHNMPPHSQQQYGPQHDRRGPSMPIPPPPHYQHTQHAPWFTGAPSHSPIDERMRRVPSNYPPGEYDSRPS